MINNNYLDKTLLSDISTIKTDIYLSSQGWQKTGEIKDFASTWRLKEKDMKLLLPLNKDYADFEARMFEVIYILEKIEKRSSYEIIDVLKTTQKHLFALGDVFGGKSLKKTENTAKSELEISVLSTFHGSFGFRLGFGSQRQLDIENNCISKKVSKSFLNLLKISGEESISTFRNYIKSQEKEILRTFRLFIKSLKTLESDFMFDWGSVGRENEEIARLSHSKVLEVDDALSKEEEENPNQIKEEGKFIQAGLGSNKDERKFIFETQTGKRIEGYISQELIEKLKEQDESFELTLISRRYKVIIQENVKVHEITGEMKITNEIIEME